MHTCARHLLWLYDNRPSHFEERRSETAYYSKEGIPECMPEDYRRESIVDAYQLYYMMDKMSFARYKIPAIVNDCSDSIIQSPEPQGNSRVL